MYLPVAAVESDDDTVVPTVSSDEDASETNVGEDDDSISDDSIGQCSPSSSCDLRVCCKLNYMKENFRH